MNRKSRIAFQEKEPQPKPLPEKSPPIVDPANAPVFPDYAPVQPPNIDPSVDETFPDPGELETVPAPEGLD